jgi:hypothetical protein
LEPTKTNLVNLEVKPPSDAISGTYFLRVLTITDGKDYLSGSEVDISGFDTIPLSGNIPLFLFVILVSGLITYALASLLLRHKVDFSYLQVSILSIALGLVNWLVIGAIASLVMNKPLYSFFPIQSIQYNVWGVVFLFIAGAAIGALVFGIGLGISRLARWNRIRKQDKQNTLRLAQNQTDLLRKGYTPTEKVWVEFFRDFVNHAKKTLGSGYTLLVKVHLKESINNQQQLTGLLSSFEPSRPYDIVLFPKHTFYFKKEEEDLISELTEDKRNRNSDIQEPSPLRYSLTNDPDYRSTMIRQYLKKKEIQYIGTLKQMIDKIVKDMENKLKSNIKGGSDTFLRDLQVIDFSKHLGYILARTDDSYVEEISNEYNKPLVISGENILSLEILGYHPFYAISFQRGSPHDSIPKSYNFDDYTFTRYTTID